MPKPCKRHRCPQQGVADFGSSALSPGSFLKACGLGFDLGSDLKGSARDNVFGHSGSTGTICWADPTTDSVCVVLTTLPGRAITPQPRELVSRRVVETLDS
ncbi:hypothetical protein Pla52o_11580 [Novipirellula galeiformis]|uniref:Uncharacterized protein n=1 Tax=Novipirellula galeiformis TaxID=2528004 RepID=A0A5C6CN03_9BACT|nr:serine hydrolase [Novipirellula galeiformis]TWU24864.1 hypothetical protein Pla52o_11580 [Novipirellula galeiformis]